MELVRFDRQFFASAHTASRIGQGPIGGKASGLCAILDHLLERFPHSRFPGLTVGIPRFTVVCCDHFDVFLKNAAIREAAASDLPDDRIAHAFQQGELPPALLGDLRSLAEQAHVPLAVRSSSLLEDERTRPFAGVYATKMIPNNSPDPDERFRRLTQALKLVWASTFFAAAKAYRRAVGEAVMGERMAVIIQELVGQRVYDRFYPTISAVARSYNFYPASGARPEEGVVELALGLGKSIVDGEAGYAYSPAFPRIPPPFKDVKDLLRSSQTAFWAVDMSGRGTRDPLREAEYLTRSDLAAAEYDNSLRYLASTYDARSDCVVPGVAVDGPRIVDFAPILKLDELPLNDAIREILRIAEEQQNSPVEIELAVTLDRLRCRPASLGFLQVRPLQAVLGSVRLTPDDLGAPGVVIASSRALGHGEAAVADIVYADPDAFSPECSPEAAREIALFNERLVREGRPYLLVGFGRFGTSDPWCGIPVAFGQIAGARAIVEAVRPGMETELSQGSHFFHNVTALGIKLFSVATGERDRIDWAWLQAQPLEAAARLTRHVRLARPVAIRVDGLHGLGVVTRDG